MAIPNEKWQPGTGKQVILKSDFVDIERGILTQGQVRMQPSLVWVDAATVRVEATPDCPATMQLNGIPNILNPSTQVSGSLSDGIVRTVDSNVSLGMATGGLYGITQTEKSSQWYAIYAIAAAEVTTFNIKAMPIMRFYSQSSRVITIRNNLNLANIGYGFTTDELVGGKIYFISGTSKGLMRTILHNNNNNSTGGTIEYSGSTLSASAGDWFFVLPFTNFRFIGTVFNNSSGNIRNFLKIGNRVQLLESSQVVIHNGVSEDISGLCPLATESRMSLFRTTVPLVGPMDTIKLAHPSDTNGFGASSERACDLDISIALERDYNYVIYGITSEITRHLNVTLDSPIQLCKYIINGADSAFVLSYAYPPGCGF